MNDVIYYILCALFVAMVMIGISLMSKVKTAALGNRLSAVGMASAIITTLVKYQILTNTLLWACIVAGLLIGMVWASRAKMIQMPQIVALYNGFGGLASAIVAGITMAGTQMDAFSAATAVIALAIGLVTLTGSVVAAMKLHKMVSERPVTLRAHAFWTVLSAVAAAVSGICAAVFPPFLVPGLLLCVVSSSLFGILFAIRVGGADMPITISLLNSLSGVAGAVAGMAVGDVLLVAVGGIVGASGLILTQVMCKAMNRSLMSILLGKTSQAKSGPPAAAEKKQVIGERAEYDIAPLLKEARKVIIIPGYGMALAQAQHEVRKLAHLLEEGGAQVLYAIHPVAGRMPGHMNVLLCEADVPYDKLVELERANPEFETCDLAVIIGANDVVNPSARDQKDTPIYGMPVLDADKAKHILICNYDLNTGYAGVPNPLYEKTEGVSLMLGDAKDSLSALIAMLGG